MWAQRFTLIRSRHLPHLQRFIETETLKAPDDTGRLRAPHQVGHLRWRDQSSLLRRLDLRLRVDPALQVADDLPPRLRAPRLFPCPGPDGPAFGRQLVHHPLGLSLVERLRRWGQADEREPGRGAGLPLL